MKKKSSKIKNRKKSSKRYSTKRKSVKKSSNRLVKRSRKNPRKLTESKLLELSSRRDVDTAKVLEFLRPSYLNGMFRETALESLQHSAQFEHLNIPTVKAIREGIDLFYGYEPGERVFDFSRDYGYGDSTKINDRFQGYLEDLSGKGDTYPSLSRKRGNWY